MSERPPMPPRRPVLGHTLPMMRKPRSFLRRVTDEYGDIVELDLLGVPDLFVVASPEYARQVLVTDVESFGKTDDYKTPFGDGLVSADGELWRKLRTTIQPLFHRDALERQLDVMGEQIRRRVEGWTDGEVIDVEEQMKNATIEVLFATILGEEIDAERRSSLRRDVELLNEWFDPVSYALPRWVPTPGRRRFRKARSRLESVASRRIDQRKADPSGDDLLSLLLRERQTEGADWLTDERIRDQLVTMLFGGYETTAMGLTFAWHLLDSHPEVACRFRSEVDSFDDGPMERHLSDLSFTDAVVTETLRRHPPAHSVPRGVTDDTTVGGYRIPGGSELHVSITNIHHDDRFYDDPYRFDPSRWDGSLRSDLPNLAYCPFGGGRRACIGREFALMEAKLLLAVVGRRWTLEREYDDLATVRQITTQPKGDVPMRVRSR